MNDSESKVIWRILHDLRGRIEKLESYCAMEDRITASDFLHRIEKLETICESRMANPKEKSSICSDCKGKGSYAYPRGYESSGMREACLTCIGKGIVWG